MSSSVSTIQNVNGSPAPISIGEFARKATGSLNRSFELFSNCKELREVDVLFLGHSTNSELQYCNNLLEQTFSNFLKSNGQTTGGTGLSHKISFIRTDDYRLETSEYDLYLFKVGCLFQRFIDASHNRFNYGDSWERISGSLKELQEEVIQKKLVLDDPEMTKSTEEKVNSAHVSIRPRFRIFAELQELMNLLRNGLQQAKRNIANLQEHIADSISKDRSDSSITHKTIIFANANHLIQHRWKEFTFNTTFLKYLNSLNYLIVYPISSTTTDIEFNVEHVMKLHKEAAEIVSKMNFTADVRSSSPEMQGAILTRVMAARAMRAEEEKKKAS